MNPTDAHTDRLGDRPHIVYRLLDHNGVALYIGCTVNLEQRLKVMRSMKALWRRTVRVTTEHHDNRSSALAAERAAIRSECPSWNTHWNQFVTDVAEQMFRETHGCPPRDVLQAWDHGRANHDELVRRVRTLRGEHLEQFPLQESA